MSKQYLLLAVSLVAAGASQAEGKFFTTVGVDYSSGEYGTSTKTTILSIPVALKYETGAFTFKGSLPWLQVKSPAGSTLGPDGRPIGAVTANRATQSGIGDLVTSVTWAAFNDAASATALDLTGKVKWATADEDKGLGTGENDFSVQADIYKTIGKTALFATLGYKMYGDPAGIDFRNVGYGGVGFSHRVTEKFSAGLTWDYRPKVTANGDPTNELTAFMSNKLTDKTKLQLYAVKGLSDGSPDWGGGLTLINSY